ncbi:MAG: ParA family protein [Deltaproteobacteria bacterium]|nr:ParA family protein [Deltaproteobacteria bacterium]MBN2672392.1 ParA family protein [Deltaproteobacteria bacterium]
MARIISIANQKGGVGKTTTAINLGASLAAAEKTVLIIDLDPQANATSGLGVDPDDNEYSSYDVLIGECDTKTAVVTSELDFLDVLPAHRDLAGAEVELVQAEDRAVRLKRALDGFENKYDFIIIDCPPSLGMLTLNALCAADAVIVPLQCEYYALEGLTRLLETIGMLRNDLNSNLVIDGIVLTMYDKRNNLSRQVEKEVRENFDGHVFKTIIPRNVKLSESPSFGKPAILYDVRSPGSQQYLKFAQEYLAIQ